MRTFVGIGHRLITIKPEQVICQEAKFHSGVFGWYSEYIKNHIMTQLYEKIIQSYSFGESCSDDAEFMRRAQRNKTGSVVF